MQNKKYFETYKIPTVKEAMNLFATYGKYPNLNNYFVFRGHKDIDYPLIPSAIRVNNKDRLWLLSGGKPIDNQSEWENWQIIAENNILKQFYNFADRSGLDLPQVSRIRNNIDGYDYSIHSETEEWLPDELMEVAGLAQHYGLLTRLLDWTYDYKIALYFATSGLYNMQEEKKDCVVWAINYNYFNFLKPTLSKTPLNFYRPSYHGNKYLSAQKGLFSTWKIKKKGVWDTVYQNGIPEFDLINRTPLDELICNFFDNNFNENDFKNNKLLYRFIIPNEIKSNILKQLKHDNFSEEYLFPGFQGVCLSMENNGKLYDN